MCSPSARSRGSCASAAQRRCCTPTRYRRFEAPFRADTLGADLISVSGHKLNAPKGVGALYIGPRCRAVRPLLAGGGQERGLRSGTEATAQIAGFAKAVELRLEGYEESSPAWRSSSSTRSSSLTIDGVVRIRNGDAPHILSVSLVGYPSANVVTELGAQGICISAGSACHRGKLSHVYAAMKLDKKRRPWAFCASASRPKRPKRTSTRFSLSAGTGKRAFPCCNFPFEVALMFSYLRQPRGFYRRLFCSPLPIIVQNLITTSLGFLDTFMVGLLGSEQMSAVTVANSAHLHHPAHRLRIAERVKRAHQPILGPRRPRSINRVIGIGLCIAGSVSTLFALIMAFFPADVLLLVTDNLRLVAIGTPYIRIVGFSYILNSLSSIYIGMQRSIENPRLVCWCSARPCSNTVGNYVLIFGKLGSPARRHRRGGRPCSRAWWNLRSPSAMPCAACTVPLQWSALLRPGREMLHRFIHYSAPVLANETL